MVFPPKWRSLTKRFIKQQSWLQNSIWGAGKKLVPCRLEYQSISVSKCFMASHNSNVLDGPPPPPPATVPGNSPAKGLNKLVTIIVAISYLFKRDLFKKTWSNWHNQWHGTGTLNPSNAIAKFENEWSHFMTYCGILKYILWSSIPSVTEVTRKLAQILN